MLGTVIEADTSLPSYAYVIWKMEPLALTQQPT